ncbi:MAG: hypothetical protein AB7O32_00510 [Vicinamibacterales bacterium]
MATSPSPQPVIPKPLFDLDTVTPRACITVNGQPYDLLTIDQVSIAAFHQLQRLCPRYDALMQKPDLDDDESLELSGLLIRIVRLVLEAPEDVQARLTDNQRLQIVLAFTRLSRTPLNPARATTRSTRMTSAAPSIGAKRYRGSAASTRVRRRGRG